MLRVSILGAVSTLANENEEAGQFMNLRRMLRCADELANLGFDVHVPGLCNFWHMMFPRPRAYWIMMGQNEIARSDACYRMKGPSEGADAEIEFAEGIGKPVFYDGRELMKWARGQNVVFEQEALVDSLPTFDSEIATPEPLPAEDPNNAEETRADFDRLSNRPLTNAELADRLEADEKIRSKSRTGGGK